MYLEKAVFTVFDVETTGLYPYSQDRICEIGALRVNFAGTKREQFHTLVDPRRPISRGAFLVNGITSEMVRGKPIIEKVLPDFLRFIGGTILVAYNAGFDIGFIECALGERREILNDYYIIDALALARRLFPGIGRYNLLNVASSLGVSSSQEHRAMADAFMTWKVFRKELEILTSDGVEKIEDIARVQKGPHRRVETVKDYKTRLIEAAIKEEKRLSITYRSLWNGKTTRRTITPKAIQKGYDRSYITAHCHLRNEERSFRVDCIIDMKEAS